MIKNKKTFLLIYAFAFFWALSGALISYIQSSYIGQFVRIEYVGLFIAVATFVTLISIWGLPRFIRRYNNYYASFFIIFVLAASYFLLAHFTDSWLVFIFFIINFTASSLLGITVDIFLEDISEDGQTGRIRTRYMTIVNVAWASSPLLMGQLAGAAEYANVYFWSGIILLPAIMLLFKERRRLQDKVVYKNRNFSRLKDIFVDNQNLRNIFIAQFVLRLFYCWMVIYTPLYLHESLGISWQTIGIIFTIMLLPFIILELPAGYLADRYWGEQEILIIGFLIMGAATATIFFLTSTNVIIWAGVLFMTRVGAALVEAMEEAYFFKQIDKQDIDFISFFRDLYPLSWLVGSLGGVLLLLILPLKFLFLFLSIIVLAAVWPATALEDTK